MFLIQQLENTC